MERFLNADYEPTTRERDDFVMTFILSASSLFLKFLCSESIEIHIFDCTLSIRNYMCTNGQLAGMAICTNAEELIMLHLIVL
jgi:hypothetical protein